MGWDRERDIHLLYVTEASAEADGIHRALVNESDFTVTKVDEIEAVDGNLLDDICCVVCNHEDAIDWEAWVEYCNDERDGLPVVLLAPDDGMIASQALDAGVAGFVPRTVDDAVDILRARIRSLIDRPRDRGKESASMYSADSPVEEEYLLKEQAIEEAPIGITISDNSQSDNPLMVVNDAFVELTGYPKREVIGRNCRFLQGEKSGEDAVAAMHEAINREEPISVELVNYRKNGEEFWNKVDIAPIHDETGDVKNFVGFQTDITARKEAEFEVKRERQQLEHLLDRINGLLQNILGDLVIAPNRDAVEQSVCDRIANTEAYSFCWIGRPNLSMNSVSGTSWAGEYSPSERELTIDTTIDSSSDYPTIEAFESRQVVVVDDPTQLEELVETVPWLDHGLTGIAAIPLVYQDTRYGVLTVYSEKENALNDREIVVLQALARAAATAINALERGRLIGSDDIIELSFEIQDRELFIVDLATRFNTEVEFNGSIYRENGSLRMFFTTDIKPEQVTESLAEHTDVIEVSLINDTGDENLYEVVLGTDSIIAALAKRGAKTRSLSASSGIARLTVELSTETKARAIVGLLQEYYSTIELVRRLDHSRPPETEQEFIGELKASLTERQLTVLQKAYLSGYFEWNRSVTGDELAKSMGISRPTFHQHLRAAQRKICKQLFGRSQIERSSSVSTTV